MLLAVMKTNTNAIWILLIIAVIAFVVGLIGWSNHVHEKHVEFVRQHSKLLREIDNLNQKYHFHLFSDPYIYHERLNSKATYDKTSITTILDNLILSSESTLRQYIAWANDNRVLYRMYLNEYERIRRENDLNETYYKENDFFAEIEDELCSAKIKSNVSVTFSIRVIKQYTSPQGRNHYEDYKDYSADQLLAAMDRVKTQQERKKETTAKRNAERAKMSEALRYDVLKRDGFRCRLCGLSADDGVKLHVDHIKPVAKGGKTEINNLRTLCDRCNFGKGAKYDPNGKN